MKSWWNLTNFHRSRSSGTSFSGRISEFIQLGWELNIREPPIPSRHVRCLNEVNPFLSFHWLLPQFKVLKLGWKSMDYWLIPFGVIKHGWFSGANCWTGWYSLGEITVLRPKKSCTYDSTPYRCKDWMVEVDMNWNVFPGWKLKFSVVVWFRWLRFGSNWRFQLAIHIGISVMEVSKRRKCLVNGLSWYAYWLYAH